MEFVINVAFVVFVVNVVEFVVYVVKVVGFCFEIYCVGVSFYVQGAVVLMQGKKRIIVIGNIFFFLTIVIAKYTDMFVKNIVYESFCILVVDQCLFCQRFCLFCC